MAGGRSFEGKIGHAGLGGGKGVLDEIPGANTSTTSGLAAEGSDLYRFNFQPGSGTSLAHAQLGGSGSTVDFHFVDGVGVATAPKSTAANAFKPGKVKLDPKAGTATPALALPGPGKLLLAGHRIRPVTKAIKQAGAAKLVVRPAAGGAWGQTHSAVPPRRYTTERNSGTI